ncbi:MAG TPA: hypothetical protein ENN61_02885 [Bacteroidaceae bacterium]|nr:hypothetical protein [Bacteroidaceae bacterium]
MKTIVKRNLVVRKLMFICCLFILTQEGYGLGLNTMKLSGTKTGSDNLQDTLSEEVHNKIKKELEKAKKALEEIDRAEIEKQIRTAKEEALNSIDWEMIKQDIDNAKASLQEKIKIDSLRAEMKRSFEEIGRIDWEQIRENIEKSLNEIDFDKIKREIELERKRIENKIKEIQRE